MLGNGGGEIGQFQIARRPVNSPRRQARAADSSLMEFPTLLQRGASFKAPSPAARYQQQQLQQQQQGQHHAHSAARSGRIWVAFLLCASCFLVFYLVCPRFAPLKGYGVVIDVGRREARVDVLRFQDARVEVVGSKPGVVASLGALLEYAKRIVPEVDRAETGVFVVGTGGLEWVPAQSRDVLLEECREVVHESGFRFQDEWALVISGRDEGVYEWVAANHAHGVVQSGTADTIGVLTLGDDSAQVTFVAEKDPPLAYLHQIELWGTTYNLYSYSFEKLGLETASKTLLTSLQARPAAASTDGLESKVVVDPCTPRGYGGPNQAGTEGDTSTVKAMGNFTACRAQSLALLQQGQDACLDQNYPVGGIFVPKLHGKFLATREFFHTLKYFSLPATASLADLAAAGEKYCGQNGGFQKDLFPKYEEARKPCFAAAFIVAFLHDSLGFPMDSNKVMFTDAVNSVPVEWTLGFFLTHLSEEKARSSPPDGEFFGNVALFIGLSAIAGILLWLVTRWRRPQLKTIYDLEKGRYFTTAARGR